MNKKTYILIIEDDITIRDNLKELLSEEGYIVTGAGLAQTAREKLKTHSYNVIMLDLKLPDTSGNELIKEIKQNYTAIPIIVFTGYASLESAIFAMNEGAFSYLQKPLNVDELKITLKKALHMQQLAKNNLELLERLKQLSLKDPLTGLYNYRYLRERLSSEFKRAKRYIIPLSLLMFDIDYFKSINNIYGHQYGDTILKELSKMLKESSRSNDIITRYGGEEFLIMLPDTNKQGAMILGSRLLDKLTRHNFDAKGNQIKLKIAMGLCSFPEDGVTTESNMLNAADEALHNAKELGSNKIVSYKGIKQKNLPLIDKNVKRENIGRLKEKLLKMETRVNQNLLESIYALAKAMEAKDYYTVEHSENMVSIATALGKELKLPKEEIEILEQAAMLHDLGKIGIPDNILQKKGKLTKAEYEIIKKHPKIGAEIIRSIHFLQNVAPIVLYHHERFDGLGYSSGLKGNDIPLGARIIAVTDVYQALISDRPYRKAYSKHDALKIIKESSGMQLDPEIVKAFLKIIKEKKI